MWVAPDKIALFIVRDFSTSTIDLRTASSSSPDTLGPVEQIYDFPDFRQATTFFDDEVNTWLMYYLNGAADAIKVKRIVTSPPSDTTPPTVSITSPTTRF